MWQHVIGHLPRPRRMWQLLLLVLLPILVPLGNSPCVVRKAGDWWVIMDAGMVEVVVRREGTIQRLVSASASLRHVIQRGLLGQD